MSLVCIPLNPITSYIRSSCNLKTKGKPVNIQRAATYFISQTSYMMAYQPERHTYHYSITPSGIRL